MNRLLLKVAMTVTVGCLLYSIAAVTQESPTTKKAAGVRITQGPQLESANNNSAIIRWTSDNPGGTDEHYAVIHYGTNPRELTQTAKSHIRLNRNHAYTIFRVRVEGLAPRTTYYYTIDSMEANGKGDGVTSAVKKFTTSGSIS